MRRCAGRARGNTRRPGASRPKKFYEFSFEFGIRPGSGDQSDPPRTGANAVPVILAATLKVFSMRRALHLARYDEDRVQPSTRASAEQAMSLAVYLPCRKADLPSGDSHTAAPVISFSKSKNAFFRG